MAGRPPKYNTPEKMQEAIDSFFESYEGTEDVPLLGELALFLGFANRQSLYDYHGRNAGFSCILDEAKQKCENRLNQLALQNKLNSNMAKMNLASSYGFSDKQQVEHSGNVSAQFSIIGIDADTDSQED